MNIFVLNDNPRLAARAHADRHVIKMITETAQMLSTALHLTGAPAQQLYQPTHANHPCSRWVRHTRGNYLWACDLLSWLLGEYDHRFGKPGAFRRARALLPWFVRWAERIPDGLRTPFAQAMPEQFRGPDAVEAYRRYYAEDKAHLHQWTKREKPDFLA
jgi:hypothetical protein